MSGRIAVEQCTEHREQQDWALAEYAADGQLVARMHSEEPCCAFTRFRVLKDWFIDTAQPTSPVPAAPTGDPESARPPRTSEPPIGDPDGGTQGGPTAGTD